MNNTRHHPTPAQDSENAPERPETLPAQDSNHIAPRGMRILEPGDKIDHLEALLLEFRL